LALNPRTWYPIAALASLANVVGVFFAAQPAEPLHATLHAALAVAFAVWAQRLKARLQPSALDGAIETEISALRDEVGEVRGELSDVQERLDFAERMLSRAREMDRLPDREPGK
jgi:hypothetical protein